MPIWHGDPRDYQPRITITSSFPMGDQFANIQPESYNWPRTAGYLRPVTDEDVDDLFGWTDDLFAAGRFDEVDAWCATRDVSDKSTTYCVVALTATKPAADKLPSRVGLVERCRARLMEIAPSRVDSLLSGLAYATQALDRITERRKALEAKYGD